VARIVRPQGRAGEVRVEPLTDDPRRLQELAECWLIPPDGGERRVVEAVRFQGGVPVVKLRGVASIGEAEALAGRLLAIPRSAVRPLPPGRFYPFDLAGCEVRTPVGEVLGTLGDVLAGAEHDFWVLRRPCGECLIPAVSAIVERVDLQARVVVVRPPEGLLDL
jgi:16S rRNA processing protein RimM